MKNNEYFKYKESILDLINQGDEHNIELALMISFTQGIDIDDILQTLIQSISTEMKIGYLTLIRITEVTLMQPRYDKYKYHNNATKRWRIYDSRKNGCKKYTRKETAIREFVKDVFKQLRKDGYC